MKIQISPILFEDSDCIAIRIESFDPNFPAAMRQIPRARWIPAEKAWIVPRSLENFDASKTLFGEENVSTSRWNDPIDLAPRSPDKALSVHAKEFAQIDEQSKNVHILDNCVTVRFCAEKPDRVFLQLPPECKEWKTFISRTPGKWWHSREKLWSVPRTKEIFEEFQAFFKDKMVINREMPVVLQVPETAINVTFEKQVDRVTIHLNPENEAFWFLFLPERLVNQHLSSIKNIHGRKWNSIFYCWEIPATKLSIRFLEQYLPGLVIWLFQPNDDLPERLPEAPQKFQMLQKPIVAAKYEAAVVALEHRY